MADIAERIELFPLIIGVAITLIGCIFGSVGAMVGIVIGSIAIGLFTSSTVVALVEVLLISFVGSFLNEIGFFILIPAFIIGAFFAFICRIFMAKGS